MKSLTEKNTQCVFLWHAFKQDVADYYFIYFDSKLMTWEEGPILIYILLWGTYSLHRLSQHFSVDYRHLFQRYSATDNNIQDPFTTSNCKELSTTIFSPYCFLSMDFADLRLLFFSLSYTLHGKFI